MCLGDGMMPESMDPMEKVRAVNCDGAETVLTVRVELVDSVPAIWRQVEIRGSMTLHQVHQVLQAAFDWEDAPAPVHSK